MDRDARRHHDRVDQSSELLRPQRDHWRLHVAFLLHGAARAGRQAYVGRRPIGQSRRECLIDGAGAKAMTERAIFQDGKHGNRNLISVATFLSGRDSLEKSVAGCRWTGTLLAKSGNKELGMALEN